MGGEPRALAARRPARRRRGPHPRRAAPPQGRVEAADRARGAAAARLARRLPVRARRRAAIRSARRTRVVRDPGGEHHYAWDDPRLRQALADDLGRDGPPAPRRRRDPGPRAEPAAHRARRRASRSPRSSAPSSTCAASAPTSTWTSTPPPWDELAGRAATVRVRRRRRAAPAASVRALRDPDARSGHPGQVARAAAPPRRPPRDGVRDQRARAAIRPRSPPARSSRSQSDCAFRSGAVAPIRGHPRRSGGTGCAAYRRDVQDPGGPAGRRARDGGPSRPW